MKGEECEIFILKFEAVGNGDFEGDMGLSRDPHNWHVYQEC